MKYRVKQIGDRFYPQYKHNIFFDWEFFTDETELRKWCRKLEYAEKLIEEDIKHKLITIHKYPRYNPDAHCNMTAALKQSECGTTCCTPDEE